MRFSYGLGEVSSWQIRCFYAKEVYYGVKNMDGRSDGWVEVYMEK